MRQNLRVVVVFFCLTSLTNLAGAQNAGMTDFETPDREFTGSSEDIDRMRAECALVLKKRDPNTARTAQICLNACLAFGKSARRTTDRPIKGRLANLCLNAHEQIVGEGGLPEPIPPVVESGSLPDVSGRMSLARLGGWPPPRFFQEQGVQFVLVKVSQQQKDWVDRCGLTVMVPVDSLGETGMDKLKRGSDGQVFGVTYWYATDSETGRPTGLVDPETGVITKRNGCRAEGIRFN